MNTETLAQHDTNLETVGMNTLEISVATGKRHDNVVRDCRRMFEQLGIDALSFEEVYVGGNGEQRPMFVLPPDLVNTLITGYSAPRRYAVVKELRRKTEALVEVVNAETKEEADEIALKALACKTARETLRKDNPEFIRMVNENVETLGLRPQHALSTMHNMVVKATFGRNATVINRQEGMPPREFALHNEDLDGLINLTKACAVAGALASLGFNYGNIKEVVENLK